MGPGRDNLILDIDIYMGPGRDNLLLDIDIYGSRKRKSTIKHRYLWVQAEIIYY